jgi:hypothetical protein
MVPETVKDFFLSAAGSQRIRSFVCFRSTPVTTIFKPSTGKSSLMIYGQTNFAADPAKSDWGDAIKVQNLRSDHGP